MMCAWKELLEILPLHIREQVDRLGSQHMEELRLRINSPPELVLNGKKQWLPDIISVKDLNYVINVASKYSPWNAETVAQGYITANGGHRIGICGDAICKNGYFEGIRVPASLCIRVARDYPGISEDVQIGKESILILGAPGWGKTTLLRDVARRISQKEQICVLDERRELFPVGLERGMSMDVMQGCPKAAGIEIALRTMGPEWIAVDEITAEQDALHLLHASNCGVKLLASAHASSLEDYKTRTIYQPLVQQGVFNAVLILRKDRTYRMERVEL